jgi:hypothetical protein
MWPTTGDETHITTHITEVHMGFTDTNNPVGTEKWVKVRHEVAVPPETTAERYARQTRNAAVFIAAVVAVAVVVGLIVGIAAIHGAGAGS